MEPIKGIDLKKLVEQCEIEFEEEKPFRKTDKELCKMTMREVCKHFEKRSWLEENQRWMRP
jgi:hypothetical protein